MPATTPLPSPLHWALYTSSLGNYFFHEIRDLIAAGLTELGHKVELRDEKSGFSNRADWHVVVAPHEFFYLGKGEALAARNGPKNLILFNTEQPSTQWFQLASKHFRRAAAIWDIDFESSLRISRSGHPCRYLPLGYAGQFAMFQPVHELPLHAETSHLPADLRNGSFFEQSFPHRPIDLLFLGHASARREQFFARHATKLNHFRSHLYRPAVSRPLIPGETTNMNTATSIGIAQRSKILLNVHHGVDKYFEWHRIVLLGIAQRTLVISEPCSLAPPFRANLDYVEAPLHELPERIEFHVKSADGQRQAQEIIERGYETLTRRCRLGELLQPLVADVQRGSHLHCTNITHIVPPTIGPRGNEETLSVCVVTPALTGTGEIADVSSPQVALAEMLADKGHRVTLLHTSSYTGGSSAGFWAAHLAERGINYAPLPPDPQVPLEASNAGTRSYETYLWLHQRSFDVVHLPESEGIGLYSLLAKNQGLAFEKTRFCVSVYAPRAWRRMASETFVNTPYDLECEFMERDCLRLADAITTSTDFMSGWLERQNWTLPVERKVRPELVRAPVSLSSASGKPERIRTLAYVGSMLRSSELELFCQAVERLKSTKPGNANVVFLLPRQLLGVQPADTYLRRRIKKWLIAWSIIEYETLEELHAILEQPDCLTVFSTPRQNSPFWLRHCLERGIRFLSSCEGGVTELIAAESHHEVLFTPKPAALTIALEHALKNGIAPAQPAIAGRNERLTDWLDWHATWAKPGVQDGLPTARPSSPLVSVCLVHFNRPEYLNQALASLRAQDYPNFEIILVDDGSTKPDAIRLLDKLEPEFKQRGWQIVRQKNRYLGAARNTGARHAQGEFLIFMDDDNVAKPHEISTFVRVAQKTGADILTCAMDQFTGTSSPDPLLKPRARWLFLGAAAATGAVRNCFGDANGCIRREVFWQVGGFTEDYGITHEDWEFYARAVLHGCKLETIPEALFWYRVAAGSMIQSTPIHANLQRNLRPYFAALPESLHDLLHFVQGTICGETPWTVKIRDYRDLLGLHQTLLVAGGELNKLGRKSDAEAIFIKVLQSANTFGHALLQMRTLMSASVTLAQTGDPEAAKTCLGHSASLANLLQDQDSQLEIQSLQEALKPGGKIGDVAARIKLFESPLPGSASAVSASSLSLHPGGSDHDGKAASEITDKAEPVPAVSIVIPVFNQLELTRNCVRAIRQNTPEGGFEIILVDNASTDGTAAYLSQLAQSNQAHVITNSRNEGFAHACNQGAKAAQGSLLLFLNNDTQVTTGWLDALTQAVRRPQTGVVGAKLLYADGRIQHAGIGFIKNVPDHVHRHAASDAPEVNQFRELDMVTGACLMIRRELFEQLAGFDEVFRNGVEDIDLCLRVRTAGWKVAYEPKSVVYHLEGQSAGRFNHVSENLQIFFKRWRKSFDSENHFLPPQPAQVIAASHSLFPLGNTNQPAAVSADWVGTFLNHDSLSHVNREFTGLLAKSRSVLLNSISDSKSDNKPDWPELARNILTVPSESPTVTVRHQWPPNWSRPKKGALVIMQPWEFGALPADWVRQAADVDEFWAYTNYVRNVYVSSGVDPAKVKVVPLGIDPAVFHPEAAPLTLATKKRFKFLFVGGTISRKGPDVLLKAYLENFTAADDVCLVIKDFGSKSVYAGQTLEAQIKVAQSNPAAPEILYLNEELSPEALPALYTACDSFVHPYRGEGFGLPILEAMACGLPVIITAGGSADDFATDDFSYRIPATRRSIGNSVSGMKLAGEGWMLEPDVVALGERMKWIVAHRDEARALGQRASVHARSHWTWDRAAGVAQERLEAIAAQQKTSVPLTGSTASRKTPSKALPAVAKLGELTKAEELFRKKSPRAAWEAVTEAIRLRPHHPEAFLLLAEIARMVGNSASARSCAQHALSLAPAFKPAKKFLKGNFHGNTKPEWMVLPQSVERRAKKIKPTLSVCLIVKNEERFIRQCLASVKDLADQIVVVDTGSADRTVAIAREFGAEIHEFNWCDDFSAARNAALEHATGDWVLSFDADEELPAQNRTAFLRLLENEATICWRLPLFDVGRENEGHNYVPRLFRNAPGLHFVGRVHEQVFYSIEARRIEWGLENRIGDAALRHHGYTKELIQERGKIKRNLDLLERAVEEMPDDPLLQMNYGLELCRSERVEEGIRQYQNAFQTMSALPAAVVTPETREALLTQYCTYLRIAKRPAELLPVLTSPLARQGELTASQHFLLGLAHMELEQFAPAAQQMRLCLAKRGQRNFTPINADILTVIPQHSIALCLWQTKDVEGADRTFQAAITEAPAAPKVHIDYAGFLHEQGKTVDALQLLNQFALAHPSIAGVWTAGGQIALSEPSLLEVAVDWTAVAFGHHPADASIIAQRAEALLLAGNLQDALPLWVKLSDIPTPRTLAARILCEVALGSETQVPSASLVKATGQEFVRWYWRLVDFAAEPTILQLHDTVAVLDPVLPDAAQLLHQAIAKLAMAESP